MFAARIIPRPVSRPELRLKLTPETRQSLWVLQLPLADLRLHLEKELEENPILEEIEKENHFLESLTETHYSEDENETDPDAVFMRDNFSASPFEISNSLEEYLLKQLGFLRFSEKKRRAVEELIGNLDADGYLRTAILDEEALLAVQALDPPGVGARSVEECLRLQLERLAGVPQFLRKLASDILECHLEDLQHKRYQKISDGLQVPEPAIQEAVQYLRRLNPRPGAAFAAGRPISVIPDVLVRETRGKGYEVCCVQGALPELRINPYYRKLLRQKNTPLETKEYIREKLRSALRLLSALGRREKTIEQVARLVAEEQVEFFEKGALFLKPLKIGAIAQRLGVHPSTVWRATTNKYLETPQGVLAFEIFFSRDASVKSRIRELIENENQKNPLSDEKITALLKLKGVSIARRTVAKYREALKISASYLRK